MNAGIASTKRLDVLCAIPLILSTWCMVAEVTDVVMGAGGCCGCEDNIVGMACNIGLSFFTPNPRPNTLDACMIVGKSMVFNVSWILVWILVAIFSLKVGIVNKSAVVIAMIFGIVS